MKNSVQEEFRKSAIRPSKWYLAVLSAVGMILVLLSGISLEAAESRVVRVGAFNYYPGIFKDTDGVVKGFYVDALADIGQRENIRFEYVYGSWAEGLERIQSGEVDVLTSVAFTEERAGFLDYTVTPLLTVWAELYTTEASGIDGIREVQGKRIAVMEGDYNAGNFINLVKNFHITCDLVEKSGFDEVFKAVASKEADAGVVNSTFGSARHREYGLRSTGIVFNPFDIFFAVAKDKHQDLLALLETNLANWRIQDDSPYEKARRKWLHRTDTVTVIPRWLVMVLIGTGIFALVAGAFALALRQQVKRKTRSLIESAERYKILAARQAKMVANIGDVIVIIDEGGIIQYKSPNIEKRFGWKPEELIGASAWDNVHPDDLSSARTFFEKMMQEPDAVGTMEVRYKHRDGGYRWIEFTGTGLFHDPDIGGLLGNYQDITGRKQEEAVLLFLAQSIGGRAHEPFFDMLARYLAQTLDMDFVCIDRLEGSGLTARTVSVWCDGHFEDNVVYDLKDTPCGDAVGKTVCCFPAGVKRSFPRDQVLQDLSAESYAGVTLFGHTGAPIGLIAVIGRKPLTNRTLAENVLKLVAVRAAGEMERLDTEQALKESEARFRRLYEKAPLGYQSLDENGRFIQVNQTWLDTLGYAREDVIGKSFADFLHPDWQDHFKENFPRFKAIGEILGVEFEMMKKDGALIPVSFNGKIARDQNGNFQQTHCILHDITDRKKAEAEREKLQDQLIQAQKMESVGRLAGGVAHDFNNMLGVILGHAEMALEEVSDNSPLYAELKEIQAAAQRSADLTRQLLTFARKQMISPKVLNLNQAVQQMITMLHRLIGEDIDLIWKPAQDLWPVKIDPSQVDQILANLCVNSRDAITGVGKITIETGMKTFDQGYCTEHTGFMPGDFVLLSVSDNGCGMDKETLDNLFEPFFTTKDLGKGTGLGLAMVYGIVKQNQGFINVYSEPGRGTTFRIYLPRYLSGGPAVTTHPSGEAAPGGDETLLLVEDEAAILGLARLMLERMGYRVLAASSPAEALQLVRTHAGKIDLLMTDVVMPEMNGRDLAAQLTRLYPDLKLLFMSGYTANVIAHHGVLDEGVCFIQKPFSKNDLALKLREALDAATGHPDSI
ncbi:MAG: PAS domain S-box protein [Desulfobacteraceae bacterium]|nr:PAS domain S-box protein [Desulfobacteraceae bacterium]